MPFVPVLDFIAYSKRNAYSGQVSQIRITNKEEVPFHGINLAVGAELSLPVVYLDALGINVSVILIKIGTVLYLVKKKNWCFKFDSKSFVVFL